MASLPCLASAGSRGRPAGVEGHVVMKLAICPKISASLTLRPEPASGNSQQLAWTGCGGLLR